MLDFQQGLFVIGVLLLSGGVYFAISQLRKRVSEQSVEFEQMKNLSISLQSANILQGKKIEQMDKLLKLVGKKQRSLNTQSKGISKSYEQASKMLSIGADPQDIMDCCQLTKGEIQLLSQLQKSQVDNNVH